MTSTIRPARGDDAMAVARIHVRAWQLGYANILPADGLAALNPEAQARVYTFDKPGDPRTYVTEEDGELTGFVSIEADPEPAVINALYVNPDHWRTGVGTTLLGSVRRELTALGRNEAILWVLAGNIRADHFYRRRGWRRTGVTKRDTIWGIEAEMEEYRSALG